MVVPPSSNQKRRFRTRQGEPYRMNIDDLATKPSIHSTFTRSSRNTCHSTGLSQIKNPARPHERSFNQNKRHHIVAIGVVAGGYETHQGRQATHFSMMNPLADRYQPQPNYDGPHAVVYHYITRHHDAMSVFHMDLAQRMGFGFCHTFELLRLELQWHPARVFIASSEKSWANMMDKASYSSPSCQIGSQIECGSHGS